MNNIGTIIKKLRRNQNKTQKEIAHILGIKQPQISKWERISGNKLSIAKIGKICNAIEIPISSIFEEFIKE